MATQPSSTCAGCHAPLAPGAKFCGACGRSSVAGPMPPHGGYSPRPPAPPPAWTAAQGAGYDSVLFAGPPEQTMPRVAAALAQAGVQTLGQTMGGIRFQHGGFGSRLLGEATLRPDGQGNTAVSTSVQVDQGNFFLMAGGVLVGGAVLGLVLFGTVLVISVVLVVAILVWLYVRLSGERQKVRDRVMATLQQAAAMPPAGYAPPPATPYAAPPPPYAAPPPPTPAASPADELRQLAEQRDRGVLTPAEFEAAKAAILGRL